MATPGWARRLRTSTRARAIARRLPVLSDYERRLAELGAALAESERTRLAHQMVPPGHFYSPVPDVEEITRRRDEIFGRPILEMPGIDLRLDAQWEWLEALAPHAATDPFPHDPDPAFRYYRDNDQFGVGDAMVLRAMLHLVQPARMIEVGSGYSSAVVLDTVERMDGPRPRLTFIEPYPQRLESLLRDGDRDRVELHRSTVQAVAVDVFRQLEAGDVLFIDSTHVSKTGSDVNYELFDVLPALAAGVMVHFHDVFPAFEYPESWVRDGRGWNECYALRAFLMFNPEFEIVCWPVLLHRLDPERACRCVPGLEQNPGGSIWLRRTT